MTKQLEALREASIEMAKLRRAKSDEDGEYTSPAWRLLNRLCIHLERIENEEFRKWMEA